MGSTSSTMRVFGVGNSTLKVSICASHPHDLNCVSIHSAFCLSYGEPTWCGCALSNCMYSRCFSGDGIALNFSSQLRSVVALAFVNPRIGPLGAEPFCANAGVKNC